MFKLDSWVTSPHQDVQQFENSKEAEVLDETKEINGDFEESRPGFNIYKEVEYDAEANGMAKTQLRDKGTFPMHSKLK